MLVAIHMNLLSNMAGVTLMDIIKNGNERLRLIKTGVVKKMASRVDKRVLR